VTRGWFGVISAPNMFSASHGKVLGFEEFLRHLRILKDATRTISFEFKALIQEGDIVFSNHVVTGQTIEGRPVAAHVIAEF
jgi:hypothetical protein